MRAAPAKLYHLGIRAKVSRSTLSDANEARDWRIYYEFAQALIGIARRLYAKEALGVDLNEMLTAEPGAFYVMDRGYLDFERLYALHRADSFFVTRAKSNSKSMSRS